MSIAMSSYVLFCVDLEKFGRSDFQKHKKATVGSHLGTHEQLRKATRYKAQGFGHQRVGWWAIAIKQFYTTRVMFSILHWSTLLPHLYNNPYIEPQNWMSEIYDDISRDADQNNQLRTFQNFKTIVNYKALLGTPLPPPCGNDPRLPSGAELHNLH